MTAGSSHAAIVYAPINALALPPELLGGLRQIVRREFVAAVERELARQDVSLSNLGK